jgi:hypothetical protein
MGVGVGGQPELVLKPATRRPRGNLGPKTRTDAPASRTYGGPSNASARLCTAYSVLGKWALPHPASSSVPWQLALKAPYTLPSPGCREHVKHLHAPRRRAPLLREAAPLPGNGHHVIVKEWEDPRRSAHPLHTCRPRRPFRHILSCRFRLPKPGICGPIPSASPNGALHSTIIRMEGIDRSTGTPT